MRGFALIDVMIALTLTGLLTFLISTFTRDMLRYSYFLSSHQQLRSESFALVNNLLAMIIREASAIDYDHTSDEQLSLFMDKDEKNRLLVRIEADVAKDRRQLVIDHNPSLTYLNSPKIYITNFSVTVPGRPDTGGYENLKKSRAYQPTVRIYLAARIQRPEARIGEPDENFFPWENPRISYESMYTLRNYSYSNLHW